MGGGGASAAAGAQDVRGAVWLACSAYGTKCVRVKEGAWLVGSDEPPEGMACCKCRKTYHWFCVNAADPMNDDPKRNVCRASCGE